MKMKSYLVKPVPTELEQRFGKLFVHSGAEELSLKGGVDMHEKAEIMDILIQDSITKIEESQEISMLTPNQVFLNKYWNSRNLFSSDLYVDASCISSDLQEFVILTAFNQLKNAHVDICLIQERYKQDRKVQFYDEPDIFAMLGKEDINPLSYINDLKFRVEFMGKSRNLERNVLNLIRQSSHLKLLG